MNSEKTPLVQKLILVVLTLILVCLVVLIAQNRAKPTHSLSEVNTTAEPPPETEEPANRQPPAPQRAAPVVVLRPNAVKDQTTEEAKESLVQSQAVPQQPASPQPYVTLVSPARPAAVDIVVQPKTGVLTSELCGRVRLEGKPPPELPIHMDATCSRLQERPVTTHHYLVSKDGGLANVLVYIKEGLPGNYSPPPINAPTVTVSRCLYEPYVVGMQAGQKITFLNGDNVLHNVHATSKNNREFNFALSQEGQKAQRILEKPEIFVRLRCDVHPWEFSYVGVVAHPFFSVTDTNGVFCLPAGLPHGRYVLAAAHVKAGETLKEIVVQGDNPNPIDLAFSVPHR